MFGIIKIIQLMNKLRRGTNDPRLFAKEEANDTILGVFIVPFIIIFSILFFIVGYTHLFGFSLWIGKPLFIISIFGIIILFLLLKTVKKLVVRAMIRAKITVVERVKQ